MPRKASAKDWTPLLKTGRAAAELPTGEAFRPEWIDFDRGIRVGNLEPHERITQILKHFLEQKYGAPFITDRWGRGVYWQWICWLSKANKLAKPVSPVTFACAKLFVSAEHDDGIFKCGLQVERGYLTSAAPYQGARLRKDWDWHRLVAQCRQGSPLDEELRRLIKGEGFVAEIGEWGRTRRFDSRSFSSMARFGDALRRAPRKGWAGFQLYYPMPRKEVAACTGIELVRAIEGAFVEVVPAMNLCMQVPLVEAEG